MFDRTAQLATDNCLGPCQAMLQEHGRRTAVSREDEHVAVETLQPHCSGAAVCAALTRGQTSTPLNCNCKRVPAIHFFCDLRHAAMVGILTV